LTLTTPAAPILSATGAWVKVTWAAAAPNGMPVLRYEIWRSVLPGRETLYAQVGGQARAFADLTCRQVCYYRVRARNAVGVGPLSAETSGAIIG
jgi:hypothetical protein